MGFHLGDYEGDGVGVPCKKSKITKRALRTGGRATDGYMMKRCPPPAVADYEVRGGAIKKSKRLGPAWLGTAWRSQRWRRQKPSHPPGALIRLPLLPDFPLSSSMRMVARLLFASRLASQGCQALHGPCHLGRRLTLLNCCT